MCLNMYIFSFINIIIFPNPILKGCDYVFSDIWATIFAWYLLDTYTVWVSDQCPLCITLLSLTLIYFPQIVNITHTAVLPPSYSNISGILALASSLLTIMPQFFVPLSLSSLLTSSFLHSKRLSSEVLTFMRTLWPVPLCSSAHRSLTSQALM